MNNESLIENTNNIIEVVSSNNVFTIIIFVILLIIIIYNTIKILNRQKQIDLFDKKYELLLELEKMQISSKTFKNILEQKKDNELAITIFLEYIHILNGNFEISEVITNSDNILITKKFDEVESIFKQQLHLTLNKFNLVFLITNEKDEELRKIEDNYISIIDILKNNKKAQFSNLRTALIEFNEFFISNSFEELLTTLRKQTKVYKKRYGIKFSLIRYK